MNVGDYVRYKTFSNQIKINKIINILESRYIELPMKNITVYELDEKTVTVDEHIIKSSPNIIDLIEVGDYVNGFEINYIFDDSIKYFSPQTECDERFYNEDIKSIVTKEQFSQMEYKVGE